MQCDVCELWVHQICGLFNKGRNKEDTPYVCPSCLLDGELSLLLPVKHHVQLMAHEIDIALSNCQIDVFTASEWVRSV